MELDDSDYCNVTYNNASINREGGNWAGIYLTNSDYNNISYNYCYNNSYGGISCFTGCDNNTFSFNEAYSNDEATLASGINIAGQNNSIYNNTCMYNLIGIKQASSDFNRIYNNTVNYNTEVGIRVIRSKYNNITDNIVKYNSQYGLYLQGHSTTSINCRDNIIARNLS